jgi:hypothetical protein
VYAGLLAAGAVEAPLRTQMPDSLPDTAPWPGDERLTPVMTRRSTVDWVLQRAAAAEPRVTVRHGVKVTGRTAATWRAECGIAYFSRHYRVRRGADLPAPLVTRTVVALDEFLADKWGGDNGAVQLVVAPLAADHRFRTAREPQVFTAVLRTIPALAAWLDVMDPITGVFPMAGLHNTLRRLVADGSPVATGLHAIGDSACTTNPGCQLPVLQGRRLGAVLRDGGLADGAHRPAQDPRGGFRLGQFRRGCSEAREAIRGVGYLDRNDLAAARRSHFHRYRCPGGGQPVHPGPADAQRPGVGENRGSHGATDRFSAQGGEDLPRAAVPADDRGTPAVPGAGRPYRLKDRRPQPGVEVIDRALDDGHVTLAQVPLRAGLPDDHPGDVGPVRRVAATAAGAHRAYRHGWKAARCGRRREQGRTGRGGALTGQVAAGQVQAGRGGDTEDGGGRQREAAVLAGHESASGGQRRAANHRAGPQQSEILQCRRRAHHVGQ